MHTQPSPSNEWTRTGHVEQHAAACDATLRHLRLTATWQRADLIAAALDLPGATVRDALARLIDTRLAACRRDELGRLEYLNAERANAQARAQPPLTVEHDGRSYVLFPMHDPLPALRRELRQKGFTNEVFRGISRPTGRQRAVRTALFYRRQNGKIVAALP